jgi:universal stress protein A
MKFKPTNRGGVVVEMGPQEEQMPAQPAAVFRLRKILVPVDFSEHSRKALEYAIAFAKQFGAELNLVHVVRPYPVGPEMAPVDIESVQDAKSELEVMRKQVAETVYCQTSMRTGDPCLEIIDAAKQLDVDLIIISTHGRTGLAHLVLGSTAEKLVRHADCPVLVVRREEHDFIPVQTATAAKATLMA